MAGIGDSWGTREELLHPRDSHGRFRSKWKMSASVLAAALKVTENFQPRTFQSDAQARQFTQNLAHTKPGRFGGGKGYARFQADFLNANEDLLDGNPDEPSTKKFVEMMDASMIELPNDVIVSSVVPPAAFGLTPERLPELEEVTGNVLANRGYFSTSIGTPLGGGNGNITMHIAVPKGTKMAVPGRGPNDPEMVFDRDQELTITKVKPDGRGGYTVSAVATPKTPGENPLPETGHAGPGKPADREGAVKALQDVGTKREMGEQGASQLPGGEAAGGQPEVGGKVAPPGAAASPEADRAARRAQILGRPAGPNATPDAQREAAGTPAPTPTAPEQPSAPSVPAPQEANVPEAPTAIQPPAGATSVVTGDPATSFRDAAGNANLEAPSAGPRRREWNNAYVGITSGKKQPGDMLRELEADIANNKRNQDTEVGRGDATLAKDIEDQEKLADLIRSHFTLGEPKQREGRQAVRDELQAKAGKEAKANLSRPGGGSEKRDDGKSAAEAAQPGPLAKVAPARTDGTPQERAKALGTQAEKDKQDDALNTEQRSRWSDALGGEPKEMASGDTAGNILLDETADLLRNGRTTKPKAAARLRDQAGSDTTPEADYLRKVADAIEADEAKLPKRVPLKKAAPKAAPDVEAAESKLAGRTDKNILTGLNGLSVGDLRALGDKWGVDQRGEDKKLKLKAALAKELAAKWKATPELQRKKEGTPEVATPEAPTVPAKKVAKAAAKKAAPAVPPADQAEFEQLAPPEQRAYKRLRAKGLSHDDAVSQAIKPEPAASKTPAAKALTQVAEAPEVPAVIKQAAKKAAVKKAAKKVAPPVAEPTPEAPAVPEAPAPGIDTAERAKIRVAAKALLTELKSGADARGTSIVGEVKRLMDAKGQPEIPAAPAKAAKAIRERVEATKGPEGVSVEERVATHLLARMKPEVRDSILAEMTPAQRSKVTGSAEKMVADAVRVKKGGHDLDRIMSDAGIKPPPPGSPSRFDYDAVKSALGQGDVEKAKKQLKTVLAESDGRLKSYRSDITSPSASEATRQDLGLRITGELGRSEWARSTLGTISTGDSPELVPKKQIQEVIKIHSPELQNVSAEELRQQADAVGIKLPESATTKDEIITEIARDMIRKQLAGKVTPSDSTPPVLPAKKAAPKVEHAPIDARTLVSDQIWSEDEGSATRDTGMLDVVQKLLDGDKETMQKHGFGSTPPTPAAVGRYLDKWTNGYGGPGVDLGMGVVTRDGATRGLERATTPEEVAYWRDKIDEYKVRDNLLRAQITRWHALADKLKTTRRTPVKKAAPAKVVPTKAVPEPAPVKAVLARAAKAVPAKKAAPQKLTPTISENLSGMDNQDLEQIVQSPDFRSDQKAIVRQELARRAKAAPPVKKTVSTAKLDLGARIRVHQTTSANGSQIWASTPRKTGSTNITVTRVEPVARSGGHQRGYIIHGKDDNGNDIQLAETTGQNVVHLGDAPGTPVRAVKKAAPAKAAPAKAVPAADTSADNRQILDAQADLRQKQDKFNELEERLNRVENMDDDAEPDPILENELDIARDERDQSQSDLDGLKAQVAKKNAPKATKATVEKQVAAKRIRKAVAAEVASKPAAPTPGPTPAPPAPVKKAAKKAAATAGPPKFTREQLEDMNLGDLVDIENERGIRRVSVAKKDRIEAILKQQDAVQEAPPAKKVTAKASKASAAKVEAAAPSKAAPVKVPSDKIVAGNFSSQPTIENSWGGFTSSEVNFHDDGEIGSAIKGMGDDRRLDVGGDSLENVLGRMATDTVVGRTTQQEMIDKLKKLQARLPEGKAKERLGDAIENMDTPARTIDVPEGTPAPLAKLAKKLESIPLARADRRGSEGSSELSRLAEILAEFKAGRTSGGRLVDAVGALANSKHESQEGRFELDRAIAEAHKELEAIRRDPKQRSILRPKTEG